MKDDDRQPLPRGALLSEQPEPRPITAVFGDGETRIVRTGPNSDPVTTENAGSIILELQDMITFRSREPDVTRALADHIDFYEREFYPLSNFSAFRLFWRSIDFDTSEAAYHWEKFPDYPSIRQDIQRASSAHGAFKLAEALRQYRRPDWDQVKVGIMLDILRAKADQHEYVARKLMETGSRELIECSWRDDFWGWGPNRDGQNMLGKLWMQVRDERQRAISIAEGTGE